MFIISCFKNLKINFKFRSKKYEHDKDLKLQLDFYWLSIDVTSYKLYNYQQFTFFKLIYALAKLFKSAMHLFKVVLSWSGVMEPKTCFTIQEIMCF